MRPGFHNRDGWYYLRLADGHVRITKYADGGRDGAPIVTEIIIPPNEWASIVCSVSAAGETGERWNVALDFHGR